jgi:hypothetical protein
MKLGKIIATVALAITSISGLVAVTAVAASAAGKPPVIYNDSNGWLTPQVRPAWILIGEGGSPMAHTWHWNTWNSKAAKSTATLVTNNCIPNCAYGKDSYHKLYVTLSGLKHHNGRAYYSVMTWYTPGFSMFSGHQWSHTLTMHFRYYAPGTTSPGWF